MASNVASQHWTYEEFAQLPGEDGKRYEVIAGELVVSSSPGIPHQELVGRLHLLMRPFVDAHRLGRVVLSPADVVFGPGDYLIPDLLFVRRERVGIISNRAVEGAPDLVIEVLSGPTSFRDRGVKRQRYAHYGVAEYWIIDPDKEQIAVYRLGEDAAIPVVHSSGLLKWRPVPEGPVLEIDVAEFFRDLD